MVKAAADATPAVPPKIIVAESDAAAFVRRQLSKRVNRRRREDRLRRIALDARGGRPADAPAASRSKSGGSSPTMRRRSTWCLAAAAASSNACRSFAARRRSATNAKDSVTPRRRRPIPAPRQVRASTSSRPRTDPEVPRTAPINWPSFRGANASGVADGQGVVADWDVVTGQQHQVEDGDPGPRHVQPDRVGQSRHPRRGGER